MILGGLWVAGGKGRWKEKMGMGGYDQNTNQAYIKFSNNK